MIVVLFLIASLPAHAGFLLRDARSPQRSAFETSEMAALRAWLTLPLELRDGYYWTSAYRARKLPADVDYSVVPDFPANVSVAAAFREVRDRRFLQTSGHGSFLRRISWLYPDDGCYARSAYMRKQLVERGLPAPAKIFAFGDFKVATPNTSSGYALWWYHVAAAYRVNGQIVVFDPAVEPRAALLLNDWFARLTLTGGKLEVSVCEPYSYYAYSPCYRVDASEERDAVKDQQDFLNREWTRLVELERSPERELGDFPPWLETGD